MKLSQKINRREQLLSNIASNFYIKKINKIMQNKLINEHLNEFEFEQYCKKYIKRFIITWRIMIKKLKIQYINLTIINNAYTFLYYFFCGKILIYIFQNVIDATTDIIIIMVLNK